VLLLRFFEREIALLISIAVLKKIIKILEAFYTYVFYINFIFI